MDITGALVTAEHAAAVAAARELTAAQSDHVIEERGHGRINRRMTWATDTDEGIGVPNASRWPSSAATWPIWPGSRSPNGSR